MADSSGIRSPNITSTARLDAVIGNADGSTRQQLVSDFAKQLAATRPLSLLGSQSPLFESYADLTESASTAVSAWVYDDGAASGIYARRGGAWEWALPLPYSFVEARNDGDGEADAIAATTDMPVVEGPLVVLPIVADTTGPATVSFNGDTALAIVTAGGTLLPPGALKTGMRLLGIRSAAEFRLLTDIVDAALAAQAQSAAAQAVSAAIAAQNAAEFFDPDAFAGADELSAAQTAINGLIGTSGTLAEIVGSLSMALDAATARVAALENKQPYKSAEITIVTSSVTTLTHGLGHTPQIVMAYAICKVAEHGYAVHTKIPLGVRGMYLGGSSVDGAQLSIPSATQIDLSIGNALPYIITRPGSGLVYLTAANWRFVVEAL